MYRRLKPALVVRALSRRATHGHAIIGGLTVRCALGRGGTLPAALKREGDGTTPVGRFPVRYGLWRPDRQRRPRCALALKPLGPDTGWCEKPGDPLYNRQVRLPHPSVTDRMWREDHLYDIVLVIGHNDRPRLRGRGSAIFLHLARPGYRPTAGCIAFSRRDMNLVLARLGASSEVVVI
ncbi:MAG: L,D-transpeptidase family protein [Hyphomicrobiaceae bacterium]